MSFYLTPPSKLPLSIINAMFGIRPRTNFCVPTCLGDYICIIALFCTLCSLVYVYTCQQTSLYYHGQKKKESSPRFATTITLFHMWYHARSRAISAGQKSQMALPCADCSWSSLISQDRTAFFSPRISGMVLFIVQGSSSLLWVFWSGLFAWYLVVSAQETQISELPVRLLTGVYHSSGFLLSTLVAWQGPPLYAHLLKYTDRTWKPGERSYTVYTAGHAKVVIHLVYCLAALHLQSH